MGQTCISLDIVNGRLFAAEVVAVVEEVLVCATDGLDLLFLAIGKIETFVSRETSNTFLCCCFSWIAGMDVLRILGRMYGS